MNNIISSIEVTNLSFSNVITRSIQTIVLSLIFLTMLFMLPSASLQAQDINFMSHLDRSDISLPARAATGTEVAMEGDYAVAGISGGGASTSSFSGLALVYKYEASSDTWSEIKTLTPSLPRSETYFGWHVEIYGDLIAENI